MKRELSWLFSIVLTSSLITLISADQPLTTNSSVSVNFGDTYFVLDIFYFFAGVTLLLLPPVYLLRGAFHRFSNRRINMILISALLALFVTAIAILVLVQTMPVITPASKGANF